MLKKTKLLSTILLLFIAFSCAQKGDIGPKGSMGDSGIPGKNGPQGDKGVTGDKGPTGEKGSQGPQGEPGNYSQYSTQWIPAKWEVEDDEIINGKHNLSFYYEYEDDAITENMVLNGYHETYIFSPTQKFGIKTSRVKQTYRKIGNTFYNIQSVVEPGFVTFLISSTNATESAEEVLQALNSDEISFKFSVIYN